MHDEYWERITYFLEKTVPTAKENDVRVILPIRRDFRLVTKEFTRLGFAWNFRSP